MKRARSKRGVGILFAVLAAAILFAFTAPLSSSADSGSPPGRNARLAAPAWTTVSVELPTSDVEFPAGPDADLANVQCLICHSAGMVLRQPPLTKDQWRAEVVKMGAVFGALVPADQVEALTEYLHRINGH